MSEVPGWKPEAGTTVLLGSLQSFLMACSAGKHKQSNKCHLSTHLPNIDTFIVNYTYLYRCAKVRYNHKTNKTDCLKMRIIENKRGTAP